MCSQIDTHLQVIRNPWHGKMARPIIRLESLVFDWLLQQAAQSLQTGTCLANSDMNENVLAQSNSSPLSTQQESLLLRLFHPRNCFTFDIVEHLCFLAESGVAVYTDMLQQLLHSDAVDFGMGDEIGDTVLHRAAAGWPSGVFKTLLQRQDVDLNRQNNNGITPIHVAVLHGRQSLMEMIIERPDFDIDLLK